MEIGVCFVTKEQQRAIADFVRKFVTLTADFSALYSILTAYESRGVIRSDWKEMWSDMQKDHPYQFGVKAFQPLIAAIEEARSESELIALLAKVATTPKPD